MSGTTTIVPAALLDTAQNLEWNARKLSHGLTLGGHRSVRAGDGLEFAHYRAYTPGDDLRQLDWKLYAKTEKFYIKQSPLPSAHHLHGIIDSSNSMEYAEDAVTKRDYATLMLASLSYIFMMQGDTFSWQSGTQQLPPSNGRKKWHHSTQLLHQTKSRIEHNMAMPTINSGVLIWFTDLYLSHAEIERFLQLNVNPKLEIILVNLTGDKEMTLNFDAHTSFKDLETGEKVMLSINQYKSTYTERISKHLKEVEQLCYKYGVAYKQLSINSDPRQSLIMLTQYYNSLSS